MWLSPQILFVYFWALPSLLYPSILFNCFLYLLLFFYCPMGKTRNSYLSAISSGIICPFNSQLHCEWLSLIKLFVFHYLIKFKCECIIIIIVYLVEIFTLYVPGYSIKRLTVAGWVYTCNDFRLSTTSEWKVAHLMYWTEKWSISINFVHDYEWTLVSKKRSALLPAMVLPWY